MGERKATGDGLQMLKEAGGVSDYKRIFENHAATVYSKTIQSGTTQVFLT